MLMCSFITRKKATLFKGVALINRALDFIQQ